MVTGTNQATLQRITLITDETLEKLVIDQAIRLGVDSYICSYCSGKPLHSTMERPVSRHPLVRIELLAQPGGADAIMNYIQNLQSRNYPVTAVMDCVTACT